MDELFSPLRFVATIVWQKRYSRENRGAIGDVHEYILVYAKDRERFKIMRNRVPLDTKSAKVYKNPNNDPRGRWRPIPMTAQVYRPNQMYSVMRPSGKPISPPKGRCWSLIEPEFQKLRDAGRIWFGKKGNSAPNIIRYLDEVEGLIPWTWWPHEEVGHTDEAKKEMHAFSERDEAFETPKPERLIKRIIEIASNRGDLVLDCFAGSGTTGAVAHKMGRQWILCESETYCETLIAKRLRAVVKGSDTGGITQEVSWKGGGGFRYCTLGEPLFDEVGNLCETVKFPDLAAHVFFTETGMPISERATGQTPLLGIHNNTAVYLLFNGVLSDKRPNSGNVLTNEVLRNLPEHSGPKVIYGESCRLGAARLVHERIVFKQMPYEIKVS